MDFILYALLVSMSHAACPEIRTATLCKDSATKLPRWETREATRDMDMAKTALVVIDVWEKHGAGGFNALVPSLAQSVNDIVNMAEHTGMLVVWAIYDGSPRYHDTSIPKTQRNVRKVRIPEGTSSRDKSFVGSLDSMHGKNRTRPDFRINHAFHANNSNHLFMHSGTQYLWDRGVRTAFVAGVSLSECVLNRALGAKALYSAGMDVVAVRGASATGGDALSPKRFFMDDFEATDVFTRVFEKFFDGSVDASSLSANPSLSPECDLGIA